MKRLFKLINICLCLLLSGFCSGQVQQNVVTVLAWWNYIDKDWVKNEIKRTCHVDLAVQTYKDANEFNRVFSPQKYDIAIFESTLLHHVKQKLPPNISSNLYEIAKLYPSFIRKEFKNEATVKNLAFFFISNTVFLYNPANIALTKNDSIKSIIEKLSTNEKKQPFVLLDDPNMIDQIIKSDLNKDLSLETFNQLFNYSNLVISNEYIDYKNLGVFMTWSGEAILHKILAEQQGVKLNVITIPKYAYTTADIIAQLNDKPTAACAAKVLAGRKVMSKLQQTVYYFSPYVTINDAKNLTYKTIYSDFKELAKTGQAKWVFPSTDEINRINKAWQDITLDYGL